MRMFYCLLVFIFNQNNKVKLTFKNWCSAGFTGI
jgi:hypothetical protein